MLTTARESSMLNRKRRTKEKPVPNSSPYSAKIIRAGALISDTKTLLAHWDNSAPVDQNIERLQRQNVFGKPSRSWVEQMLKAFRQRYLSEPQVTRALVTLVRKRFQSVSIERLLYFHSARADRLLHDAVTEILLPMRERGLVDVSVSNLQRPLTQWVREGKTIGPWSEATITRIAQGLLSTLRNFGVLQGAVKKKIGPNYLPVESFAYIAFYLKQLQPSGVKLIELPDWKLFFLS